ncbi:hypothetical protein KIN20_009879 [Parelaphostrongylus tenuis]|uniref:Uncharacterized protein n=1 Tax=Parelaphostrongylus tenuis TaxID=148309 RepID=A0AAD5M714_PARTN|nr:hypothetical protein KIN20_009879 [Parelaphostrongylus tenuis]
MVRSITNALSKISVLDQEWLTKANRIGKCGLGEINGNGNRPAGFPSGARLLNGNPLSRGNNIAAGHGSHLTARRMRKLVMYLPTEDGACSTQT